MRIELVLEVHPVWDRLLFAIDPFESGQSALEFVAGVASANDASVRVLHIRELPKMAESFRSRLLARRKTWCGRP